MFTPGLFGGGDITGRIMLPCKRNKFKDIKEKLLFGLKLEVQVDLWEDTHVLREANGGIESRETCDMVSRT